jgi:hypothetical protein
VRSFKPLVCQTISEYFSSLVNKLYIEVAVSSSITLIVSSKCKNLFFRQQHFDGFLWAEIIYRLISCELFWHFCKFLEVFFLQIIKPVSDYLIWTINFLFQLLQLLYMISQCPGVLKCVKYFIVLRLAQTFFIILSCQVFVNFWRIKMLAAFELN